MKNFKRFRKWLHIQWIANPLTGVALGFTFVLVTLLGYLHFAYGLGGKVPSLYTAVIASAWMITFGMFFYFLLNWRDNHN